MTIWPSSRHANQGRPLSPPATAPAERCSGAMLMLVDEMSGRAHAFSHVCVSAFQWNFSTPLDAGSNGPVASAVTKALFGIRSVR